MRRKNAPIWTFFTLLILAVFLIFVVYPLLLILYKSVINPADNSLTLENFTRFFTRKYYVNTLTNSFKVTIVATLISATLGLLMAYITRQVRIAGSKWLNILIVVSYLSPPFIGAYAWIQLLGRNGLITKALNALLGIEFPGIYGFAGIVLVFSLQSFPLVYMYVCGALENLDNSLNEAAESLGASNFQRVTGIILPLVMPTVLASSLLVFMRVFSDFGTPMLIGEGYRTFPVVLYNQFMGEVTNDSYFAAALCVIIMAITLVFFFLQRWIARRHSYSMSALKPMQPRTPKPLPPCLVPCVCILRGAPGHASSADGYRDVLPQRVDAWHVHQRAFPDQLRDDILQKSSRYQQHLSLWPLCHRACGAAGRNDFLPSGSQAFRSDLHGGYPDDAPLHHSRVGAWHLLPLRLCQAALGADWHSRYHHHLPHCPTDALHHPL